MKKLNYTYGILTMGSVSPTTVGYRKCDNVVYFSARQKDIIQQLLNGRSEAGVSVGANMMINILQCSEHYTEYINTHDSLNTYNQDMYLPSDAGDGYIPRDVISYNDLIKWVDGVVVSSSKYYTNADMPGIVRISNALFNVLTMRD